MKFYLASLGLLVTGLASVVVGHGNPKPTVVFPITLTWEKGAPDGFTRDMILTNGQFPGPLLSIDEGDRVEFIVKNDLPFPTTIHFHGIEQIGSPWSDGVPGLSQISIAPGCSFAYKWTAHQYGTYWYHGHYRGQIEDGLFGPILIKPKRNIATPFSSISNNSKLLKAIRNAADNPEIVMLSDWSHFTSTELRDVSVAANIDSLCGNSLLINGKGAVQCPGVDFLMSLVPPPLLPLLAGLNLTDTGCLPLMNPIVQGGYPNNYSAVPANYFSGCEATNSPNAIITANAADKWISLNLISTASLQEMMFSIDEHPMWVYEIDGRYVIPQLVDAIKVSHGSRHSVLIQLNKPAQDYSIRVAGVGLNQKLFASGLFSYANGSHRNVPKPFIDYAGVNTTAHVRFLDDTTVVPFPPIHPAKSADETFKLLLNRTGASWRWTLNDGQAFNESLEDLTPLLWEPNRLSGTSLTISTKNGSWVDLVFMVTNSGGLQPSHPIHKHSNKAHLIGAGIGEFPWNDVTEAMKEVPQFFNLDNPPYRDGFDTLPVLSNSTWTVIRYQVVNPGPFLLHCHINPHLTGGMALAILDGIDKWPEVPKAYGPGGNGF